MKHKSGLLIFLLIAAGSYPCYAEGQAGMGTFLGILILCYFLFYVVCGGLVFRLIYALCGIDDRSTLNWMAFLSSLLGTLAFLCFFPDAFLLL